jgi:hypothetical protein
VRHPRRNEPLSEEEGNPGIFFDPPYLPSCCDSNDIYEHCGDDANDVQDWCRAHQDRADLRIALAGYEGTVSLPGWSSYAWSNSGGAFSPACLP